MIQKMLRQPRPNASTLTRPRVGGAQIGDDRGSAKMTMVPSSRSMNEPNRQGERTAEPGRAFGVSPGSDWACMTGKLAPIPAIE